jgi:hypothetical protein
MHVNVDTYMRFIVIVHTYMNTIHAIHALSLHTYVRTCMKQVRARCHVKYPDHYKIYRDIRACVYTHTLHKNYKRTYWTYRTYVYMCIRTCLHEVHKVQITAGLSECVNMYCVHTYMKRAYVHARYVNTCLIYAHSDIRSNVHCTYVVNHT